MIVNLKYWKYEVDDQKNVTLLLDLGPEEKLNVLKSAVMEELGEVINALLVEQPNTLVIGSAKSGFCAGADVNEIQTFVDDPESIRPLLTKAREILMKIHNAPFPVVAAVAGDCLGGGLELAMACHARVVADHPKTGLALPETQLGIIPGFGGTQTLPRIVGLQKALEIIVAGKKLNAKSAVRAGLASKMVPPKDLLAEAKALAASLIGKPRKGFTTKGIEKVPVLGRGLILKMTRKQVMKQTKGNYPALLKAVDAVASAGSNLEKGWKKEHDLFVDSIKTPQAGNLMSIFFTRQEARKYQWIDHPAVEPPKHVGVLGAGIMGRSIAYALIYRNIPTVLYDYYPEAIHDAIVFIENNLGKAVKKGKLTLADAAKKLSLLSTAWRGDLKKFSQTDFVVEAVLEDLDLKQKLLAELAKVITPETIVATNTSSLLPSEIVKTFPRPEKFAAMHFFNPAHIMDLVEISAHPGTAPETLAKVLALTKALSKTPVVLNKECSGLIVNRVLAHYLAWGVYLVKEKGVHPAAIDRAFEKYGMVMGPFKTMDLVGLDVGMKVMKVMGKQYAGKLPDPAQIPDLTADKTMLGQKTGAGFYKWERNKNKGFNPGILKLFGMTEEQLKGSATEAHQTIMKKMVTEAEDLLKEGVIGEKWMIDLAMILGAGFAPNRRGLLGR